MSDFVEILGAGLAFLLAGLLIALGVGVVLFFLAWIFLFPVVGFLYMVGYLG